MSWEFLVTFKCEIQMAAISPYIQQRILQAKSSIWDFITIIEHEIPANFEPTHWYLIHTDTN